MPPESKSLVVLLSDTYWPQVGGVEEALHSLAAALGNKYHFRIVTHARQTPAGGFAGRTVFLPAFAPYCDNNGNEVAPLLPSIAGRILMAPCLLWHLPFVRRFGAKVVHDLFFRLYKAAYFRRLSTLLVAAKIVHCSSTSYLAALAPLVCRKKGIALVQNPYPHEGGWGDSALLLNAYAQSDFLIAATQNHQQLFSRISSRPRAHIRVIAPPAAQPPPPPWETPDAVRELQTPFVLFLARRTAYKGLDLLLKAWKLVESDTVLVISGPGEPLVNAGANIIDTGTVSDSQKQWLLANCALFCLPSSSESFGIVYTEAMRHSKAVVALNITPVNEVVLDSLTGILVAPDNPRSLAAALAHLLGDPLLCSRLGRNGNERYQRYYARERIVEQYREIYQEILGKEAQVREVSDCL